MDNIRGIKLITGIDIIGEVIDDGSIIKLKNAKMIQLVDTPKGISLTLSPIDMFSEGADKQVGTPGVIHRCSMMMDPYIPHPNIVMQYKQDITGIDLSATSKPSIIV